MKTWRIFQKDAARKMIVDQCPCWRRLLTIFVLRRGGSELKVNSRSEIIAKGAHPDGQSAKDRGREAGSDLIDRILMDFMLINDLIDAPQSDSVIEGVIIDPIIDLIDDLH